MTTIKSIITDLRHTIRDGHGGQTVTITESIIIDVF